MTPPKPTKPESPKTPEPPKAVTPALAATPQPEASSKTEKTSKAAGRDGKRILSVAIPDKLARQLKLLCNVEGTTASAVVISAVQRAVNKRLGAALDAIKPDVEG
jgi:hypothetical protein